MKCPYCNGTGDLVGEGLHAGALVLAHRKIAGLTQMELSEKCGISRGQIANLETGRTDIPLRTLGRIAGALGCSMKDLVP